LTVAVLEKVPRTQNSEKKVPRIETFFSSKFDPATSVSKNQNGTGWGRIRGEASGSHFSGAGMNVSFLPKSAQTENQYIKLIDYPSCMV